MTITLKIWERSLFRKGKYSPLLKSVACSSSVISLLSQNQQVNSALIHSLYIVIECVRNFQTASSLQSCLSQKLLGSITLGFQIASRLLFRQKIREHAKYTRCVFSKSRATRVFRPMSYFSPKFSRYFPQSRKF